MDLEFVTIPRLAELTGYSVAAIEKKVGRGVFAEGLHYLRSEEGRLHFHIGNYNRWVKGEQPLALKSKKNEPTR